MIRRWRFLPLLVWGCGSPTPPPPSPAANVASITFSADSLVGDSLPILAGDTTRITVKALDANGKPVTGITFIWSSSDATVATVSSTGLVTAIDVGDADIIVTVVDASHSAISASQMRAARGNATNAVHLKSHPTLLITPTDASIDVGGTMTYTAEAVNAKVQQQWGPVTATWASSNPPVATVSSSSGQATGVSPGTTLITGTATVKGRRISASVKLVVTNCAGIKAVGSWNATITVSYNAGPISGEQGTGTTLTASQGSIAKGTLQSLADTVWYANVTGVANVNNTDVGPKATVYETASNQSLQPNASLELEVFTDGPTCGYQLLYTDWTQWLVSGGNTSQTETGPLGITTITMNLPPPTPDSGWVLKGNVSLPATATLLVYGPGSYEPLTGVGAQISMLHPSATSATVSYRIAEQP